MNKSLFLAAASMLVVVAACNQQGAPPPANEVAANQTSGEAESTAEVSNAAASIRARQTHYKQIGKAMKGIGDELKASNPSVEDIRMNAARIAEFAPQVMGWFPAGSGAEAGLKTRAKQEIWSEPEGFRQAAERFAAASEAFHDATQTGDLEAIRAAQKDLGGACKNCHDDFRAPEE